MTDSIIWKLLLMVLWGVPILIFILAYKATRRLSSAIKEAFLVGLITLTAEIALVCFIASAKFIMYD